MPYIGVVFLIMFVINHSLINNNIVFIFVTFESKRQTHTVKWKEFRPESWKFRRNSVGIPGFRRIPRIPAGICGGMKSIVWIWWQNSQSVGCSDGQTIGSLHSVFSFYLFYFKHSCCITNSSHTFWGWKQYWHVWLCMKPFFLFLWHVFVKILSP